MNKTIIFLTYLFIFSQAHAADLIKFEPLDGTWRIANIKDQTIVCNENGKTKVFSNKTMFLDCAGQITHLSIEIIKSNFTVYAQQSSNATSEEESHVQVIKIICE